MEVARGDLAEVSCNLCKKRNKYDIIAEIIKPSVHPVVATFAREGGKVDCILSRRALSRRSLHGTAGKVVH